MYQEGDIVMGHLQLLDVPPRGEHEADYHGRDAGIGVDSDAPREVDGAEFSHPTTAPDPVGDGVVDKQRPEHHEDDERLHLELLRPGPRHDDGHHERKHHLECREQRAGDAGGDR